MALRKNVILRSPSSGRLEGRTAPIPAVLAELSQHDTGIDLSAIHPGDWGERWLPAWAEPYARLARLDRPIGTWLMLLPGWCGISLGLLVRPDSGLFALFSPLTAALR